MKINELAFAFVRDIPEITSIVIGVEKLEQLKENISMLNLSPLSTKIRQRLLNEFSDLPEALINPILWRKDKKK
jgi:aryl-alcohol dehydrogenase-like predicted oxidoreductase